MIDWTKPIQTYTGKPARLLGVLKNPSGRNHVVAIGEYEFAVCRYSDGCSRGQGEDIINVPLPPRKFVRWVNLYEDAMFFYVSRKAADISGTGRIGCRRVELAEWFDDESDPA